eukprot:Clim_evm48s119 gene=Clim_evmTU48s119
MATHSPGPPGDQRESLNPLHHSDGSLQAWPSGQSNSPRRSISSRIHDRASRWFSHYDLSEEAKEKFHNDMLQNDEWKQKEALRISKNFNRKDTTGLPRGPRSLYLFKLKNPFRQFCINFVEHRYTQRFIAFTIVVNIICLALYQPEVDADEYPNRQLAQLEKLFLAIYSVEALVKLVAYGGWQDENAYFRALLNRLDFLIVILGWVDLIFQQIGQNISAFFALRALRLVRLIGLSPRLTLIVVSLMNSVPKLAIIFIMYATTLLLWAITGLEFFAGDLNSVCALPDGTVIEEPAPLAGPCDLENSGFTCSGDAVCIASDQSPNDGVTNYDNIGFSLLTIFQCSTLEGWAEVMYWTQDAVDDWTWVFYLSLVFLCSFFLVNLFLGVIAGEFHRERARSMQQLQKEQRFVQAMVNDHLNGYMAWVDKAITEEDLGKQELETTLQDFDNIGESENVEKGTSPMRIDKLEDGDEEVDEPDLNAKGWVGDNWKTMYYAPSRRIDESVLFQLTIDLNIIATLLILSLNHWPEDEYLQYILLVGTLITTFIFVIECCIRIPALGIKDYFAVPTHWIDFIITLLSVMAFILDASGTTDSAQGLLALRAFRLFSILNRWNLSRQIVGLSRALVSSLKVSAHLFLLIAITILMFAIFGLHVFGQYGEDSFYNFSNFGRSLLSTLVVISGENWNDVMYDVIPETGLPLVSSLYFVILVFLGTFILLNVALAIAVNEVERYDQLMKEMEVKTSPQAARFRKKFNRVWNTHVKVPWLHCKLRVHEFMDRFNMNEEHRSTIKQWTSPIVDNKWFDRAILFIIFASAVMLIFEEDYPQYDHIWIWVDVAFSVLFCMEIILKVSAWGWKKYWSDGWNRMDFILTIILLIGLIADKAGFIYLRSFRILRAFRPLRSVSAFVALRKVIWAAWHSIASVGYVITCMLLIMYIFALIGVYLYRGSFGNCNDPSVKLYTECNGTFVDTDGATVDREWENAFLNFDNVANALFTLFVLATFEGWPEVMEDMVNSSCTGCAQEEFADPWPAALFMVSYLTVVSLFLVSFFTGTVVGVFREASEADKTVKVDGDYVELRLDRCVHFAQTAKLKYCRKPLTRWQASIHDFVTSLKFEIFIFSMIVLNIAFLATQYSGMSETHETVIEISNMVFTAIFVCEAMLKLLAYGFEYFVDDWNKFDFAIIVGSIIDLVVERVTFFRIARVFRLIRIMAAVRSVREMLWTLRASMKSLPSVLVLVCFVYYGFATVGVGAYGSIEQDPNTALNRWQNFSSFPRATQTLIVCSTGEDWFGITEAMVNNPGGSWTAIPFMIFFVFMSTFLALNVFTAVVLDYFEYLTADPAYLTTTKLARFGQKWEKIDVYATGFISLKELETLMAVMEPPVGCGKHASQQAIMCKLRNACIPLHFPKNIPSMSGVKKGMPYVKYNEALVGMILSGDHAFQNHTTRKMYYYLKKGGDDPETNELHKDTRTSDTSTMSIDNTSTGTDEDQHESIKDVDERRQSVKIDLAECRASAASGSDTDKLRDWEEEDSMSTREWYAAKMIAMVWRHRKARRRLSELMTVRKNLAAKKIDQALPHLEEEDE